MNHIADNEQAQTIGGEWSIIHHFFDFRAHDGIANNMEGLVRSLLVQFIEAESVEIPASIKADLNSQMTKVRKMAGVVSIAYSVCRKAVLAILESSSGVLLLLDGLDEFADSKAELLTFINDLCVAVGKSKSSRICLASRPETKNGSKFTTVPGMLMQDVNQEAIEQYARHCFSVLFGYDTRHDEYERLARRLSEYADGVFLWAYHAVRAVTVGLTEGEDLNDSLEARLNESPKELGEVYARIFTKIAADPIKRQLCTLALLLITSSREKLTLTALFTAMKCLPDTIELCRTFSTSISHLSDTQYKSKLLAACPGLLEIHESGFEASFRSVAFTSYASLRSDLLVSEESLSGSRSPIRSGSPIGSRVSVESVEDSENETDLLALEEHSPASRRLPRSRVPSLELAEDSESESDPLASGIDSSEVSQGSVLASKAPLESTRKSINLERASLKWLKARGPDFTSDFLSLTHRTVAEYLENVGWKRLYPMYHPSLAHELWLHSSLQVIQDNREHLDNIADSTLNGQPQRHWFDGKGFMTGSDLDHIQTIVGALYYMVKHFPTHAAAFERLSKQSSYSIFGSFKIARLPYYHSILLLRRGHTCCSVFGEVMLRSASEVIHVAIKHSMNLYIESYLAQEGDRAPTRSEILGLTRRHPSTSLAFYSFTETRTVKDMVRGWAIEDTTVVSSNIEEVTVQTLRAVLKLAPGTNSRELVAAVMLCPGNASLALLQSYKADVLSSNKKDWLNFIQDRKYYTLINHIGVLSSMIPWSLGKRVWYRFNRHEHDVLGRRCKDEQSAFWELYEAISRTSTLEHNITAHLVLFGLLDGPLPWYGRLDTRPYWICFGCCQAVVQFCLARCTMSDLIGPHGNLLESAYHHMLCTSDDVDTAFHEISAARTMRSIDRYEGVKSSKPKLKPVHSTKKSVSFAP